MRPEDTHMASGRVDEPGITIPEEAWASATNAIKKLRFNIRINNDEVARAACIAMLRNWPGMEHYPNMDTFTIILPLTENTNDKG